MKQFQFNVAKRRKNANGDPAVAFGGGPAYEFLFRTEWMEGGYREVQDELINRFPPLEFRVTRYERDNVMTVVELKQS